MIVMPSNASGWLWHVLARETGRIGHLHSPAAGRKGPWPWIPYAIDNGAYVCWNQVDNSFMQDKWDRETYPEFLRMMDWATEQELKPEWVIVPDIPGNAARTIESYDTYVHEITDRGFKPALALQDGMVLNDVRARPVQPYLCALGGTREWKLRTVYEWADVITRLHILRCNSITDLYRYSCLEAVVSVDGSGWGKGDRLRLAQLEAWARQMTVGTDNPYRITGPIVRHATRQPKLTRENTNQLTMELK